MTAIDKRPLVASALLQDTSRATSRGTPRRVDSLGRVVIPAEYRKLIGVAPGDMVDVYVVGDEVAVRRVEPHCVLCGEASHLVERHAKWICQLCLDDNGGDTESKPARSRPRNESRSRGVQPKRKSHRS
jgi:transcriptional pleiotropic regulator of transition state genes